MPNYVTTKLEFDGEDINEIKEFVESNDNIFDFSKIVPYPKYWECPEKYLVKPEDIEAEKNEKFTNGMWLHSKKFGISVIENIPYLDWYNWQIDNWGTKWNSCEATWEDNVVWFETAWSFPAPVIEALSKKFPKTKIYFKYSDEDAFGSNHDSGMAENGVVSFDNLTGRELNELIVDIQGDFYYVDKNGELKCSDDD